MSGIDQFFIVEEEEYRNGDTIFREGSPTDWLYVVLKGQVKVQKNTAEGLVTVATLKEGDFLGELAFLETGKVRRSASAVAVGEVRLGVLDRDRLEREYNSLSPDFRKVILTLVHRLRATTERATRLAAQARQPS
ncbi:MAG: cyclic nucleotide-binding domain-containing protein [Deltaproteobacteria bacterium]|nr:cyclic nucleotide-binding domain-containing protein [Deltaproteobacteria bacterium]